jgi:hypothetical protein
LTTDILNTRAVTIDDTTGLPVLPEDLFWRIEEARLQTYFSIYGNSQYLNTGTVEINLIRKTVEEIPAREQVVERVKTYNFGIFSLWEEQVIQESSEAFTETYETVLRWGSLVEHRNEDVDKNKYEDRFWNQKSWDVGAWKAEPPTKENIRNLATKVWFEHLDQQHGLVITEDGNRELSKFLGDFPPKNLNDIKE